MKFTVALISLFTLCIPANHAVAAQSQLLAAPNRGDEYVRLAGLSDGADIIAMVQVRRAIKLPRERAPGLSPGTVRLYVEADVLNLISGQGGLTESIRYLVDVPQLPNGKAPKIKKQRFIIFANRAAGRTDEVQLSGPDAHIAWSQAREAQTRSIVRELLAADSPPAVTGIGEVFHVPGNLKGEGETQIFLRTTTNEPVSISIIRRPGLRPSWAVSLTEIVDAAATRPSRGTLLWFRLACSLPRSLPGEALYSRSSEADAIAREDYALVLRELGPCE